jgi:hypothetical protein
VRVQLHVTAGSEKGRTFFELHGADSFRIGRSGCAHPVLDPIFAPLKGNPRLEKLLEANA